MSKVLVTGATGFIGSHIVIQLLNEQHQVKATMRNLDRAEAIKKVYAAHTDHLDGLSFAQLDLMSDEGWEEAFKGMDYVIHVASPIPAEIPKNEDDIIEPARQGALRALKAAAKSKVKRVVITSSVAAVMYGHSRDKTVFTEEDWSVPAGKNNSAYTRSKTLAEKAAWEFLKEDSGSLEMVAINPGMVLGPVLENDYGTSAVVIKKLLEGTFPGTPRLGWPVVDVRDVARLHVLAMTHPEASGQRFIAAHKFMWMNDMARVLRDEMPEQAKKVPKKNLPNWLMRILANFDKEVRSVIFELGLKRETPGDKAQKILKWTPRPGKEAVLATAESLIKHGAIKG